MDIKYKIVSQENLTKEFVYSLLKMELFETSYTKSLLKELYTNMISEDKRFDAILAYSDNKPVGIAVIQPLSIDYDTCLLSDGFNNKSKPQVLLDKKFHVYGFLQLYVKDEFRNKGIATKMAIEIETFKLSTIDIQDNELPTLVAKGDANSLAKKHLKYSAIIQSEKNYTNLPMDIHWLTYNYMQQVVDKKTNLFLKDAHMNYVATRIDDYVKQKKISI